MALVFLRPAAVEAQTGRVTMQATVSETVALSVLPNFTHGHGDAIVVSNGNTVRITLANAKNPVLRVPLLVRSNSSFKISLAFEPKTDLLAHLSIADVRATGTLVSPHAINQLNVPDQFDLSGLDQPLLVVSGPRVSLGGTLVSPNNALQITLFIRLKPQLSHRSLVHLTFAATAARPIQ
jgi:hypothetical protein